MMNYTGNPAPAGADTPSPDPGPGVVPIIALPQDTIDSLNEASIDQAMKTLADNVTWLLAPTPKAAVSAAPAWWVKNVRGHKRSGFDHRGFPGGRVLAFDEDWIGMNSISAAAVGVTALPRWKYNIVGTGGSGLRGISVVDAGDSGQAGDNFAPELILIPHVGATGDVAEVYMLLATLKCVDDTEAVMDFYASANGSTDMSMKAGFMDLGRTISLDMNLTGAFFEIVAGNANWQASTGDGTTVTRTDTGVAWGPRKNLRIELCGKNTDDAGASTGKALFFIDGVQKAARTANLPFVANSLVAPRFGAIATTNTADADLRIAGLKYRSMLAAGDAF